MSWISIKDLKPVAEHHGNVVLVVLNNNTVTTCGTNALTKDVTHWMKLPKPPCL